MLRTVVCLAFASLGLARADDGPVTVRVVTADGKPAASAKAWIYGYTGTDEIPKEPTPLVADDSGKLTVPDGPMARTHRQMFVRDGAGRIGWTWLNAPWMDSSDDRSVEVVLVDVAAKTGRVTTIDGKAIAGAVVTPLSYSAEERRRGRGGPAASIALPEWEQSRLAVKTDADGRFKLIAPVSGYSLYCQVKATGFGETKWLASSDVDIDTPLSVPGTVIITVVGLDPTVLKGLNWRLDANSEAPTRGVHPSRWRTGAFDGTEKLTVRDVVPGKYVLTVHGYGKFPCVFEKAAALEVATGKTAEITAKFGPAVKVTGKITNKDGKGVAKVQVFVNVTDGTSPSPRTQLSVETDVDGNYVVYGPAGWYRMWLQTVPDGYAVPTPTGPQRQLVEPVKLEVGKAHVFAPIALLKAATLSGQIVLADGKPAASATVSIGNFMFQGRGEGKVTANKDGTFAIPNLAPDDCVAPRVRLGKAVNVPEIYDLEKVTRPVTIELSEANATTFKGRVVDAKGKPIAGAKVELRQNIQGIGRNASFSTSGTTATIATNANGQYEFVGMWPGDTYRVNVMAAGHSETESKDFRGEAGKTHDFGDLKLTRASLSVRGTVVGVDGKPILGAEVVSVDGPSRFSTSSAADGSFTLTGFYEGGGFVLARKAGFRLTAVAVTPGDAKPTLVTLAKADGSPVKLPEIPASHHAAIKDFTRHSLTLIWDSHATFGYGGNALENMARIDPATARRWRDEEKKRTDGKSDFTNRIDSVEREKTLFTTAKDDPDEALAIIHALKADDGFAEAERIGKQMLAVDKAKALRFAEEAVVKARQRDFPARIWSLAQAGDLAVRAGGVAGGKKVLAEAAELAAKLGPDERGLNSLALGLAAAHLAPYDWDRAETLLSTMKDPSDFNRYLSAAAARVARTDLSKAKQLLTRFKPDNTFYSQEARLRVAYAIAREQPDEALKLIDGVEKGPYRFFGYLHLAIVFTPTDKARSTKMIDTAFDLLDRDPEAFRSWSDLGGRWGLAAVGAVRAKEIGYPDVPLLIARCLALRPTAEETWSPENREEQVVKLAAVLALIDLPTARQVLATIGTPEDLIQRAVSQRRDWLFALALTYPEQAKQLADKLIERAKDARGGRNALSETGLVELCSILTARDRLKELTNYGGFSREINDED